MKTTHQFILVILLLVGLLFLVKPSSIFNKENKEQITSFKIVKSENAEDSKIIDSLINDKIDEAYHLGYKLREWEAAIILLRKTSQHKDFTLAKTKMKSFLYYRLGTLSYSDKQYYNAIDYLDTSIIYKIKDETTTKASIAKSYYVRAMAKYFLNLYTDALEDINIAIKYIEIIPEQKKALAKYYSLAANFYQEIDDSSLSENYFQKALFISEKVYGSSTEEIAILYFRLGKFYLKKNKHQKVREILLLALDIFNKNKDIKNLVETKLNIAASYINTKEFNKAKSTIFQILQQIEQNKKTKKEYIDLRRRSYNNLAFLEREDGNYEASKKYYRKVLAIANEIGSNIFIARAYEGLGDVDQAQDKFDASLENYQKAIQTLCPSFKKSDFNINPNIATQSIIDRLDLERILALKAETLFKKYQNNTSIPTLKSTLETYKRVDSLIVQRRQSYKAAMSRYDLVESTLPIYESATQAALELFKNTTNKIHLQDAFNFSSKNKAIVMLEGLQDERAKFAGIPTELRKKERTLKKEFYDLETQVNDLAEKGKDSLLTTIKNKRFANIRNYEKLIDQLEHDYPAYHQLKYAFGDPVIADTLIHQMPLDAAIIEYFVGQDSIYIFTLSKEKGLHHFVKNKPEQFNDLCHSFRSHTQKDSLFSPTLFSQNAFDLYQLLLAEPLQFLNADESINRLFIIPDQLLLQLSFDALFYEKKNLAAEFNDWSTTALPYLINKYAISYAYSNRLLFDDSNQSKTPKENLIPFAGFALEYDDFTLDGMEKINPIKEDIAYTRGLGKLYFSVEEVKEIANITDGKAWTNEAATKKKFLLESPHAKVLHMAMHSFVNLQSPLNSGLIFSRDESDSTDFILTAADIYSTPLHAEMAVLSACHTGNGQLQKGEGARTLARAFHYAGCPSLVASLWSASDIWTKDLMISYYSFLDQGFPKDVALQKAKLYFLQNENIPPNALTPNNWAHLITIGDTKSIQIKPYSFFSLQNVVLLLGALSFFGFLFWWKKN